MLIVRACFLFAFATVLATLCNAQRTYRYDANGNRIEATGQVRFSNIDIFHLSPSRVLPGERLNIFGRNLEPGTPSALQVEIGGVSAPLVSVSERVLTVTAPSGAQGGAVVVILPSGVRLNAGNVAYRGVSLTPSSAEVDYGESFVFQGMLVGVANGTLEWLVEDVVGGNASVGTIDSMGNYTAPIAAAAGEFPFRVTARDPMFGFEAHAIVRPRCATSISIPPRQLYPIPLFQPSDRVCYDFSGVAGEFIFAASRCKGDLQALRLRSADGNLLAVHGPGTELKLNHVRLPETGTYRIELEGSPAVSGLAELWFETYTALAEGQWMLPWDGRWNDPLNWSRSTLPGPDVDCIVPDMPTALIVSIESQGMSCRSLVSEETLHLNSGSQLTVTNTLQVHADLHLRGGTLSGAEVLRGRTGEVAVVTGGVLEGVTLQTDVFIWNSRTLEIRSGLQLRGGASVVLLAFGRTTTLYCNGSQTIGGQGNILFAGASDQHYLYCSAGSTLHIEAGVATSGSGTLGAFGTTQTIHFEGPITASEAGQKLAISAQDWSTSGSLQVDPGAELELNGNWTNQGTVSVDRGTLLLGGTFTIGRLGTVTRQQGRIAITGTLDNNSSTLALDANSGTWELEGGTILGGTIETRDGETLAVLPSQGTLDGITLDGNLTIERFATARVLGGIELSQGLIEFAPEGGAVMQFVGAQSVRGQGVLQLGSSQQNSIYMDGSQVVTFESGIAIGGSGFLGRSGAGNQVQLNGHLVANEPTKSFFVYANLVNTGTLRVENSALLNLLGTWEQRGRFEIDRGSLQLQGTGRFTPASSWSRNEGALHLMGTLDNTASTFTLDQSTGSMELRSGSVLRGGLFATRDGTLFDQVSSCLLEGATLDGDLHVRNGQSLRVQQGLDLTANGRIELRSLGSTTTLYFDGTQSVTGPGQILMTGNANTQLIYTRNGQTLTIGPAVTIAGKGTLGGGTPGQTFICQGVIRADQSGERLLINPAQWTQSGTLVARNESTLALQGNWTNAGTIDVDRATVELGGQFSFTGLGTLQRQEGAVKLLGTMDNQGQVLAFNTMSGSWDVEGGTLIGGQVTSANGEGLSITRTSIFDGVELLGQVIVQGGSRLRIQNDLNLTGGIVQLRSKSSSATLELLSGSSLLGSGTIDLATASNANLVHGQSNESFTIGAGVVLQGTGRLGQSTTNQIILEGTCRSVGPLGDLDIGGALELRGTLEARDGARIDLEGPASFASSSTLRGTSGTIALRGTLDNTGQALTFTPTTGSLELLGGTIAGGRVVATNGYGLRTTSSGGFLDGVTIEGILLIGNGDRLTVRNDLTLDQGRVVLSSSSSTSSLIFEGSQAITGTGEVLLSGTRRNSQVYANSGQVLTIETGILVRGCGTVGAAFATGGIRNEGTIRADDPSEVLEIRGSDWTSVGRLEATQGGELSLTGSFFLPGALDARGGKIALRGTLRNTSTTLALDAATGSVHIESGSLIEGGILSTSGGSVFHLVGGVLEGVTLAGDSRMPVSSNVTVRSGLTLSTATLTMDNTSARLNFQTSQSLNGNGTIRFEGSSQGAFVYSSSNGTLTIEPGVTIRGQGYIGGIQSGSSLVHFRGHARAGAGEVLRLAGGNGWIHDGTAEAEANGIVELQQLFTVGANGSFRGTQGEVRVTGTLDNTNSTLALDAASGPLVFQGTLLGGTLQSSSIPAAIIPTSATFTGVMLAGTTHIADGATLNIQQNLILANGAVELQGGSAVTRMIFSGSQAIQGTGSVRLGGPGVSYVHPTTNQTLTIDAGVTVEGSGQLGGWFSNTGLDLQGTARASNGDTLVLDGRGGWTHAGHLQAEQSGTLSLLGPYVMTPAATWDASTGTILLSGALDNTGRTFGSLANGFFTLSGGSIQGGIVNGDAVRGSSSGGRLQDIELRGSLELPDGAIVEARGPLAMNQARVTVRGTTMVTRFYLNQVPSVTGTGTFQMEGTNSYVHPGSSQQTTLAPGILVHGAGNLGGWFGANSFVNQGTIRADVAGERLFLSSCRNEGTVEATGAALLASNSYTQVTGLTRSPTSFTGTLTIQGGVIEASGIVSSLTLAGTGVLRPGSQGTAGSLEVTGSYNQRDSSILEFELGGTTPGVDQDELRVRGTATLGGELAVALLPGYGVPAGSTYDILTYGRRVSAFATTQFPAGVAFNLVYGSALLQLVAP